MDPMPPVPPRDGEPRPPQPPPPPPPLPPQPTLSWQPQPQPQPKPVRACDPIAAAVGNATLLGIGYVLLKRWPFAALNWLVTLVLVGLLLTVERPGWVQVVTVLVWAAVTVHGWLLATRQNRRAENENTAPARRRQRLIAGGPAALVVLALVLFRFDAWRIENAAAEAHRADKCEDSREILDGLWAGHRLVDPALVNQDAPESREACGILLQAEAEAKRGELITAAHSLERYRKHPAALWKGATDRRADLLIEQAGAELRTGLTGDTNALRVAFNLLATALAESPRKAPKVEQTLNGFLGDLPVPDPCVTSRITDWLGDRSPAGNELDEAFGVVSRIAPAAILGCGDQYLAGKSPEQARERYRQLLDQYPRHGLASKAKQGERKATLTIQLTNVRNLLGEQDSDGVPLYCGDPAPYGGAKPYRGRGKGPYRTLLYGANEDKKQLATSWLAKGATDAVLVMCAGDVEYGSVVETCPYHSIANPSDQYTVVFYKQKVPVSVYELRTGKLITKTSVQIDGSSCPYEMFITTTSPVVHEYVNPSRGDVRAAYKRLIDP